MSFGFGVLVGLAIAGLLAALVLLTIAGMAEAARKRVVVGREGVLATHVPPVCTEITGRKSDNTIPQTLPKEPK